MSMVDIATGFHMSEVVKEGGGCIMDRGLHNRGAVAKMLSSHGCNIELAPLEAQLP